MSFLGNVSVWLTKVAQKSNYMCYMKTLTLTTNTHTHRHTPFNDPLSRTTQVSQCQKGKTNLDFTEARDSEWRWHQLGHMQVCTSLQTDNHASTSPLSFLQAGCPSCRPTNSVKALKVHTCKMKKSKISRSFNINFISLQTCGHAEIKQNKFFSFVFCKHQ